MMLLRHLRGQRRRRRRRKVAPGHGHQERRLDCQQHQARREHGRGDEDRQGASDGGAVGEGAADQRGDVLQALFGGKGERERER